MELFHLDGTKQAKKLDAALKKIKDEKLRQEIMEIVVDIETEAFDLGVEEGQEMR